MTHSEQTNVTEVYTVGSIVGPKAIRATSWGLKLPLNPSACVFVVVPRAPPIPPKAPPPPSMPPLHARSQEPNK
eukprot:5527525-Amphidinium_carterae.1